MQILVINAGSSSVKAAVIDPATGKRSLEMNAERLLDTPVIEFSDGTTIALESKGPERAIAVCLEALKDKLKDTPIAGVGHRVVHGGKDFDRAARIDEAVEAKIEALETQEYYPIVYSQSGQALRRRDCFLLDSPHQNSRGLDKT